MALLRYFTFFCGDGATETQVFPVINDFVLKDTRDKDYRIVRRSLETELIFDAANSYEYFRDIEDAGDCSVLTFIARYKDVDFFTGNIRFKTNALKFDRDKCSVRIRVESNDAYTCLFRNWEREFNIYDIPEIDRVTVNSLFGELEELTCTSTTEEQFAPFVTACLPDSNGWVVKSHDDVPSLSPFYEHTTVFVREKIVINCDEGTLPPGDGWILVDDNCPTDQTYVREPDRVYDAANSFQDDDELHLRYIIVNSIVDEFDNGVRLTDILETFNPCEIDIVARFFSYGSTEEEPVPDNTAYDSAFLNLRNVIVYDKSDIKRPDSLQNAFIGTWTYKSLLDHLRYQYNILFTISDFLRIEHYSFFEAAQGIDLTIAPYSQQILGLHQYTYDNSKVTAAEKWQFMEQSRQGFDGVPIEYDCFAEDDAKETTYSMNKINNDVGYILQNPDQFSDDGFSFINAYEYDSELYLQSEASVLDDSIILNAHQSVPNLQENYHRWGRPLIDGTMNQEATTFASAIKRKDQEPIQITMCIEDYIDWNASELVKSQIGWGEVQGASYSCATKKLTLNLLHD